MALTEFGKAVRKARIEINETLLSMANALDNSCIFKRYGNRAQKNLR